MESVLFFTDRTFLERNDICLKNIAVSLFMNVSIFMGYQFGFFVLRLYQSSWVIKWQINLCRLILVVLVNSYLGGLRSS